MKQCVITGSNRGVGFELVRSYLSRGDWHVHACCREPEKADALRELVTGSLGRITLHSLEVTDPASVEKLANDLSDAPIDLLINNAGIMGGDHQELDNMDFEAWAEAFAVNAIAPFRVAQALLPALRRASGAKIATISSQLGALNYKSTNRYAYCSSKAAVNKTMRIMAEQLRDDEITCVLFHPGWVKTDMGGQNAELHADESAGGIARTLERLTLADTGCFFKWNGEPHVW
ncbi:NAD(P)-dependent dehydrogenase, short-chain alcohol dehydrogenase family [Cohaesibacter sp. ES.047]|uniref:SDR family oxidoreductase n=1 Tax=Cohaesibacter sp. ES.047 TaxID=1798205 RepID=UPI000BB88886|nr:SDR family oxidoreductase [Cohaesibacter sp. ES.047]SNY91767.1 NAD(P)-dependent dehydrogenase, short-chain alcohol dehydrogenase family [Cohaesibacter sp. ES.047]